MSSEMTKDEKYEYWVMVLEEFKDKRISKSEYYKANDIPVSTFNCWQDKIESESHEILLLNDIETEADKTDEELLREAKMREQKKRKKGVREYDLRKVKREIIDYKNKFAISGHPAHLLESLTPWSKTLPKELYTTT